MPQFSVSINGRDERVATAFEVAQLIHGVDAPTFVYRFDATYDCQMIYRGSSRKQFIDPQLNTDCELSNLINRALLEVAA